MKLISKDSENTELIIDKKIATFKGEEYEILVHDGDVSGAGYIATNNFVVKEDHIENMVERFGNRKGNVDTYEGFAGFMLLKKDNKMSVLTGWQKTEDFTAWVESEAFQNSHVKKEQRVKSKGSDYLEAMPIREGFIVEK